MALDRVRAEVERAGDQLVAVAGGDVAQHLELARAERRPLRRWRARRARAAAGGEPGRTHRRGRGRRQHRRPGVQGRQRGGGSRPCQSAAASARRFFAPSISVPAPGRPSRRASATTCSTAAAASVARPRSSCARASRAGSRRLAVHAQGIGVGQRFDVAGDRVVAAAFVRGQTGQRRGAMAGEDAMHRLVERPGTLRRRREQGARGRGVAEQVGDADPVQAVVDVDEGPRPVADVGIIEGLHQLVERALGLRGASMQRVQDRQQGVDEDAHVRRRADPAGIGVRELHRGLRERDLARRKLGPGTQRHRDRPQRRRHVGQHPQRADGEAAERLVHAGHAALHAARHAVVPERTLVLDSSDSMTSP